MTPDEAAELGGGGGAEESFEVVDSWLDIEDSGAALALEDVAAVVTVEVDNVLGGAPPV